MGSPRRPERDLTTSSPLGRRRAGTTPGNNGDATSTRGDRSLGRATTNVARHTDAYCQRSQRPRLCASLARHRAGRWGRGDGFLGGWLSRLAGVHWLAGPAGERVPDPSGGFAGREFAGDPLVGDAVEVDACVSGVFKA